jgi:hypothetical protein
MLSVRLFEDFLKLYVVLESLGFVVGRGFSLLQMRVDVSIHLDIN